MDDAPEIKPEPSSPVPTARIVPSTDDDQDDEMQIKDMKPSVEVSFKGTSTEYSSPNHRCRLHDPVKQCMFD